MADTYHVKDHVVREVVNRMRDTALEFHAHGSLRERLARELEPLLVASRPAEVDDRTPRPISTAPHDGTEVLAWSITGKTWHQVYWKTQEHGNWLWEKPFPPRWACRWNSDYYQGQNEFSHWLPIPGAPSHTTNKEK